MGCGNCRGISKFGATLVIAALFSPFSNMSVPGRQRIVTSIATRLDSCLDHPKAGCLQLPPAPAAQVRYLAPGSSRKRTNVRYANYYRSVRNVVNRRPHAGVGFSEMVGTGFRQIAAAQMRDATSSPM